jgi:hypothetical protein
MPDLPDIMLDVTPTLALERRDGMWRYVSKSGHDLTAVLNELEKQAARLDHRSKLCLEAAALLRAQANHQGSHP